MKKKEKTQQKKARKRKEGPPMKQNVKVRRGAVVVVVGKKKVVWVGEWRGLALRLFSCSSSSCLSLRLQEEVPRFGGVRAPFPIAKGPTV
jgi:hypothetical protein